MADLILLYFQNEEAIRCSDLVNATSRVKAHGSFSGKAIVKIMPEYGNEDDSHVTSLEFDTESNEWVPTTA